MWCHYKCNKTCVLKPIGCGWLNCTRLNATLMYCTSICLLAVSPAPCRKRSDTMDLHSSQKNNYIQCAYFTIRSISSCRSQSHDIIFHIIKNDNKMFPVDQVTASWRDTLVICMHHMYASNPHPSVVAMHTTC